MKANRNEDVVLQSVISLAQGMVRDYTLQGSDIWCYHNPENVCGLRDGKSGDEHFEIYDENDGRGKPIDQPLPQQLEEGVRVRIRIHYSYSDVQRYNALLEEWRVQIQEDIDEYNEI